MYKIDRRGGGVQKSFPRTDPKFFLARCREYDRLGVSSALANQKLCLHVCLYFINVKTAEPIGSKLLLAIYLTVGKVYGVRPSIQFLDPPPPSYQFCT